MDRAVLKSSSHFQIFITCPALRDYQIFKFLNFNKAAIFKSLNHQIFKLHLYRMKKAIIAILAILYVTIASGVVVNVHYCMGRIASVAYGYDDHDVCGKCGMSAAKKGCCHTEYKLVKLQDEHRLAQAQVTFLELPAETPVHPSLVDFSAVSPAGDAVFLQYHSPPDPRLNTVYLSNCVFRI